MNILVLGGTAFLGRHFVDIARHGGHQVTLFNRGTSAPALFPGVRTITGDRYADIERLKGERFDAVVDTGGYFPANVTAVTALLQHCAAQYLYISSCSVYDMQHQPHDRVDEQGRLVPLDIDPQRDDPDTYGARKYLCEQAVRAAFPGRHVIIRPGLIVGPHDPTYRFPYWADRIAEGGAVLAPGDLAAPLQFIDVRDLAQWMLLALTHGITGTFNTVSPSNALTLGGFLQRVTAAINPATVLHWVPEAFLRERQVDCWTTLPLWIHAELQAFQRIDSSLAIGLGLRFRSIEDTVRDTHHWSKPLYRTHYLGRVLGRQQEQALINEYVAHA